MALACTARLTHPCMVSENPKAPPPLPLHLHTHRPMGTALTSSSPFVLHSVDVSKDDKPLETPPPPAERKREAAPAGDAAPLPEELIGSEEDDGPKLDPRRFEEKFAVLNTGIHECRSCGYRYDQAAGDPSYPVPPGLPFAQLPDDWRCPTCGAAQSFFESKSVEIAGFAQNQQFGLGGNSLTSGQKGLLIFGSLLLGFLFFISGYFLQ
uniref:Rubredoxin-like domain-containing protein n=1 Tax=Arundo donax TaxID=35708 RepID=A0A0A9DTG1_ARUDO